MKRKILSLLLCFTIIFASFSTTVAVADTEDLIPGEIIVIVSGKYTVPETSGNFDFYGVVVASVEVLIDDDEPCLLLILPEGANSQEETEAAIEILKANPKVIIAEQNAEWSVDDPIEDFVGQTVYKLGDVNGDGVHDTADYTLIKRAISETYTFSEEASAAADVNGNGQLDTADYLLVKRSTMNTYNIQLPMTALDEVQIDNITEDYLDYMEQEDPFMVYTKEDVFIDEAKTYGPYGNNNIYVVQIFNIHFSYPAVETTLELGGRTLEFPDADLPYVWTGNRVISLKLAYDYGYLSDVDLEDLETRYNIED